MVRLLLCALALLLWQTCLAEPVTLDGRPVFNVMLGYKADTAASRADAIGRRLLAAAEAGEASTSIKVAESDTGLDITAGTHYLCTVYAADAHAANQSIEDLARQQAVAFGQALDGYRAEHTTQKVLLSAAYATATWFVAIFLIWLVQRLQKRIKALVYRGARQPLRALERGSHRVLRARALLDLFDGALQLIGWAAWLLIVYSALARTLAYFPATRTLSQQLGNWLIDPLREGAASVGSALPKLLFLAVVVFVTRSLLRVLRYVFSEIEQGRLRIDGFYPDWASPTRKIVSFLLIIFAIMVAYPYIPGSGSEAFKGVSLFLGVLLSLGSSGAVSNIVAGVILTYMRAYRVGDLVRIGDVQGVVVNRSLLVTKLQTIRNQEITLPNSVVLQGHVTNLSSGGAHRGALVTTSVTIGYDTPWRQVQALLIEAANSTDGVLPDPAPFVLQTDLQDFYVRYELNAYTNLPARLPYIQSALNACVQDTFNRYGVQIMSPHYFDRARAPVISPPADWHAAPAQQDTDPT
ncbi:MAG: mechanosensitive ion channel family protein [Burkholderiales bacterium]|nr:mechanosensitive ion channel family protein [Burkholderiales bacterium]